MHTSLYIGPGLGIGAGILIILILLLITFSFGYRLWYVISNKETLTRDTKNAKPVKKLFGPSFYLALATSFLIILTFNPSLFGGESEGIYSGQIFGLPIWASIMLIALIVGALIYLIYVKLIRRKTLKYSYSPLHGILLLGILNWFVQDSLSSWILSMENPLPIGILGGFIGGVLLGQGILWLKPVFFKTAKHSLELLDQLLSPPTTPNKLERLNEATNKTLKNLAVLIFYLAVLLIVVYSVSFGLLSGGASEIINAGWAMVLVSVGAIIPFLKKSKSSSAYSDINQLFHHLILDHYHIGKALLKRQIKGVEHPVEDSAVSAVLVTGLARAGTTALTRTLSERGSFRSLDYSNMPVLLAPRLWAKFYRPSRKEQQERAHGDGIKVGLASVEALEEYFFKVVTGDRFVKKDRLVRHELSAEENEQYRRYFKSLCKPDEVYLAKNNNAVLRLPSLLAQNPDMKVFVLVREPLEHAYSLYKQHLKFSKEQAEDPFVLTYMNWLGHHEFGQGQLPFDLGALGDERDREKLDFWLERWVEYYSYAQGLGGVEFIRYEEFLARPSQVVERIAKATGMTINAEDIPVFEKTPEVPSGFSPDLTSMAQKVYEGLG